MQHRKYSSVNFDLYRNDWVFLKGKWRNKEESEGSIESGKWKITKSGKLFEGSQCETHLGLLTGACQYLGPPLPQNLGERDPMFCCCLEETVYFGSLTQALWRGLRSSLGGDPELLKTILVFVHIFIDQDWGLSEKRAQRRLARVWSRRTPLSADHKASVVSDANHKPTG